MTIQEKALELHEKWNGKLETVSKTPVKSREDLSLAYTPGVAEPCKVIAKDKEAAYKYTMKANTVAVVLMAVPFWDLATSDLMPLCPSWKAKPFCSRNLVESMRYPSAWIHRIQKKSSRLLPGLRLLTAESIWKISQLHAVLKSKRD